MKTYDLTFLRWNIAGIALLLTISFVSTSFVSAQQTQQQQPGQQQVPTQPSPGAEEQQAHAAMNDFAKLGPKNKGFIDSMEPYGKVLSQMQQLTVEFQTATPERKDEIVKAFNELRPQSDEYRKKMVDAAIDAFRETPFQNHYVNGFLIQLLQFENASDNYEVSFKIADALMQNIDKAPENAFSGEFYAIVADAAFGVMEFDKAEAWFKKAKEMKAELTDEMQQHLAELPKLKPLWAAEQKIRAQEAVADDLPRVLLHTNKGDITLELFENEAPNTVANFISLVKSGFYTNVPFHRVLSHFMAQGGDPTGTGMGGPGYSIDCECYPVAGKPSARNHFRGSISMANAGRNTNGSQFFLMFVPVVFLNGPESNPNGQSRHTVFGRVIDGMEVLADIQRIDPDAKSGVNPDVIVSAKVLRDRGHEYKPVKNNNRR